MDIPPILFWGESLSLSSYDPMRAEQPVGMSLRQSAILSFGIDRLIKNKLDRTHNSSSIFPTGTTSGIIAVCPADTATPKICPSVNSAVC